jgi:hypothetical protein
MKNPRRTEMPEKRPVALRHNGDKLSIGQAKGNKPPYQSALLA